MSDLLITWLVGWGGAVAGGLLLWGWSLFRRDVSVVDIWWGPFFLFLAAWFRLRGPEPDRFQLVALAAVALWALRLALHIAVRSRGEGEDRRYAAMRAAHGPRFPWVSLGTVFLLQSTLATLLAAPLLAVQSSTGVSPALFTVGLLLWLAGFAWEAVADAQLLAFRRNPANAGKVLDRGLWRFSRHPNYFGEAILWWGYGAMGLAAGAPWTLFAPAVMTWLLLRVSGVTLLEKTIGSRRPEYAEYVRRTSAFLPLPPRPLDAEPRS